MTPFRKLYLTYLIFYIGWFGIVGLAQANYSYLTLVFPAILFAYLYLIRFLNKSKLLLALVVALVGIMFDSICQYFKLVSFNGSILFNFPVWLISIWILFSLSILKIGLYYKFPQWTAIAIGFFFGPLSYKSGEVFSLVIFDSPNGYLVYAIFWALFFPFLINITKRFS